MMTRGLSACGILIGSLPGVLCVGSFPAERARATGEEAPRQPAPRRPVALALADDGKWLFIANQGSGSIAVIDTGSQRVAAEVPVGRKLSDLVVTPDGGQLLAVDEEAGELVVYRRRAFRLEAPLRIKVSPFPVSVRVAEDGSHCTVASLWSRRVTVVSLPRNTGGREATTGEPQVVKTIELSFPPRLQLPLRDPARVIVADAFGGRLAVLDPARGKVESDRALPAHNIRGLAVGAGGTRLLVAHQVLSGRATTGRDDVHWGNLITNGLRELPLANVLDPKADLLRDSRLHRLGDVGRGAGDPSAVVSLPGGNVLVVLAGVGEVSVGGGKDGNWRRLAVGRRPTALALSPDGERAYVADTHSDSVSIVDLKANKVSGAVALGPEREPGAAERGELLFYDARLSHDGWFSCHSCHTDGHSNGLLADTLGDGSHGTPKRVLTLLGVKDTGPWAWNGTAATLEAQVRATVESTLQGRRLSAAQEGDLVAYLRTLAPAPPLGRFRETKDGEAVGRGREVFERQRCGSCHAAPTYTSDRAYDVGLSDEARKRNFNPPSLRGVSQAGPYFHDGSAATLAEVFTRHRHQLRGELGAKEQDDLLAFLESL
jgi:YVTN family beta-propeller protein